MFSAFYLPLVLLLVALIVRGISFEFRGKGSSDRWRQTWDRLMTGGSLIAPLLIGIALGNLVSGIPINAQHEFTGSLLDLLHPYPVFVGLTFVLLCAMHGATFLSIRTTGDVRARSAQLARRVAPVTAVAVLVFVCWTHDAAGKNFLPNPVQIVAVLAVAGAAAAIAARREGLAFTATTVGIGVCVVSLFVDLYPRVMVSSTSSAFDLTVDNAASGSYALKVITVVAATMLPVVLAYTAWTYYVFRRRITAADVGGPRPVPQQRSEEPAEAATPAPPTA